MKKKIIFQPHVKNIQEKNTFVIPVVKKKDKKNIRKSRLKKHGSLTSLLKKGLPRKKNINKIIFFVCVCLSVLVCEKGGLSYFNETMGTSGVNNLLDLYNRLMSGPKNNRGGEKKLRGMCARKKIYHNGSGYQV